MLTFLCKEFQRWYYWGKEAIKGNQQDYIYLVCLPQRLKLRFVLQAMKHFNAWYILVYILVKTRVLDH